jgi:hypothetical protein
LIHERRRPDLLDATAGSDDRPDRTGPMPTSTHFAFLPNPFL